MVFSSVIFPWLKLTFQPSLQTAAVKEPITRWTQDGSSGNSALPCKMKNQSFNSANSNSANDVENYKEINVLNLKLNLAQWQAWIGACLLTVGVKKNLDRQPKMKDPGSSFTSIYDWETPFSLWSLLTPGPKMTPTLDVSLLSIYLPSLWCQLMKRRCWSFRCPDPLGVH